VKSCAICKSNRLRSFEDSVEVRVPGHRSSLRVIVEGVRASRCDACGEVYTDGPDMGRAEALAALEAVRVGLRSGPTLNWARRALGLRAADLAELLDVAPETVSRWENGHRSADRSVWNTVADLLANAVEGKTSTQDLLRQEARPPRAPLRVVLRPAYGR
jgi:YgiT-type zinc finger domain-containing protein